MSYYPRLLNGVMLKSAAALQVCTTILMLGLMMGCSTNNPTYHDYRLVAASPEGTAGAPLPATLGVFPVTVPGWLDRKNITWSDGGVRLTRSVNGQWGEPLPELLTQSMVQNLRRQVGTHSWVSAGPWGRDKRPAVVVFADVQSIAVVNHQLQVDVAWSMEGQDRKVIAQREKVYGLAMDAGDSTQAFVHTLSGVWGLVAKDMVQALPDLFKGAD